MARVGKINWPQSGYEAVVFDLDGTLVHSMPWHFEAWCEALEFFGAANVFQEDIFYAMGGRPSRDIVVDLNRENGLKLDPGAVTMKKRDLYLERLSRVQPIDEVVEFARDCERRGIRMAIATGGTHLVAERTLQATGLSDLFEDIVTSEDVKNGKPAPDIYLKAAQLLGVTPSRCLAAEDAASGIRAAEAAGMKVVTIPIPIQHG